MRICQNRPLDKFMRSSTSCIVTYGAIKIYAVQIMQPALDSHNSHKSHTEICCFTIKKFKLSSTSGYGRDSKIAVIEHKK